jgi:hypothetical protein
MRIFGALILSSAWLLASCANNPFAQQQTASCEMAKVPGDAVFGVREGMDIATYPPKLASGHTGCQRVWYGERQRPEAMQVLATYHFDRGRVSRLTGRVPGVRTTTATTAMARWTRAARRTPRSARRRRSCSARIDIRFNRERACRG